MQTDETTREKIQLYAEFREGLSDKFYAVEITGSVVALSWGRRGTKGQIKVETHGSAARALAAGTEQFQKKLDRGYVKKSALEALATIGVPKTAPRLALTVPTNWGMYTPAGNKRMTEFGQKFADKGALIAAGKFRRDEQRDQANALLSQYVGEWRRICATETYGEASDSEVRDAVGYFFDRLRAEMGVGRLVTWEDLY